MDPSLPLSRPIGRSIDAALASENRVARSKGAGRAAEFIPVAMPNWRLIVFVEADKEIYELTK